MLTRAAVCAAMAAARLAELALSRRNVARFGEARESARGAWVFPLIVALHTTAIAGTFFAGGRARVRLLLALAALQPLRAWVLVLLGSRWNARGAVPEALAVETRGPYAVVRHPKYAIVLAELALLPLAFRLPRFAAAVTAANAALLSLRIADEERALMRIPAYRAHFARKARVVPFVV